VFLINTSSRLRKELGGGDPVRGGCTVDREVLRSAQADPRSSTGSPWN